MTPTLHRLLHAAAIRKHGSAADIAALAGLSEEAATTGLAAACAGGRLVEVDGKYMLSPAGQMIVSAEYSRFCAALRADAAFVAAYERFEIVNRELKQLITRWQTLELGGKTVANDHSDRAYDERIIGQLGDLHERFEAVLTALVKGEPRLGVYRDKLDQALERAEDGAVEWVSDARIDSYHTVWFELHEDLLRLLGRTRDE